MENKPKYDVHLKNFPASSVVLDTAMELLQTYGADAGVLSGTKIRTISHLGRRREPVWSVCLEYDPETRKHTIEFKS